MTEKSPDVILERALEIFDPAERAAYLDRACVGDERLRAEVDSLLAAHSSAGDFLEPLITPEPVLPDEKAGDRIGRYKLLQLIGEGTFGRVWMAEQEEPMRRSVALKIIKLGMDSREVLARFEAERQALALMDHPNIARVFDGGATESGRPYFVMERVRGLPITQYCDINCLSIRERIEIFQKVCQAVQHAHQKGVIHRDLKPSNILVTVQDDEPVPKVIDFGVAKALQTRLTERTIFTRFNQWIGTPVYMSPEQAGLGGLDIDTRSDVYALGVILYELLTGHTPFDEGALREKGYDAIFQTIREEDAPKASARLSSLSREQLEKVADQRGGTPDKLATAIRGELDWILLKALDRKRTRRYETANGLAMDLKRYCDGEPISAAPPSFAYQAEKLIRKHWKPVLIAATIAFLILMGSAATTVFAIRESRARANAERQAAISQAVNDFINKDLFAAASPSVEPDRDLKVRTVLDRASATIEGRFKEQPLVEAAIRETLATIYQSLGEYEKARQHAERSYQLRKANLGEERGETAKALGLLANIHKDEGEYDQSELLYKRSLAIREKVLGPDSPKVATSLNNLAVLYRAQGKYDEAEPLYERSLDIEEKALGPDHQNVAIRLNNLAELYRAQGKYDEAEPLHKRSLAIREKALGPDSLRVAVSLNNLAGLYYAQGKYDEAEPLHKRSLAIMEKVLGLDHPHVATSLSHLAKLYQSQGKYDEAEPLFKRSLAIREKALRPNHPDVATSLNLLAELYSAQGKHDEAESLFKRSLVIRKKALGPDHPVVATSLNNLAVLYRAQGKYDEAEPLFKRSLAIREKVLGPEHPHVATSLDNFAVLYNDQGKYNEAEPLFKRSLAIREKALGPEHPRVAASLNNLAVLYSAQGKYDEAEPLYERSLEIGEKVLGPEHPDIAISLNNLAVLYRDQGKYDKAEPLFKRSLAIREKALGPGHPDVATSLNNLAVLYTAQGKYDEAEPLYKRSLAIREKVLGAEHPKVATVLENLARLYRATQRDSDARPLEQRAASIRSKSQ